MMINVDLIVLLYEYFHKSYFSLSKDYKFKPKPSQLLVVEKFLKEILKNKSVGKQYIWNYFIFQFNYYSELELTNNYGKMNIQYVLGPKSIERWRNRDIEFDYTLEVPSKVSHTFFFEKIYPINEEVDVESSLFEIGKKRKFLNTEFGLTYCLENTDLYNPKHLVCRQCRFSSLCKSYSDGTKI